MPGPTGETVQEARIRLELERRLDDASDSLFDAIVVNEIAPATALATRMLGDYAAASEAVYAAFEEARSDFSGYDGRESPRTWALRHVADEVMSRVAAHDVTQENAESHDARSALLQLSPERRLAVILLDVLRMTLREAASVSRTDSAIVRERARTARAWLASHASGSADEAAG
jgi:DNA-directed RNA polymerase specialized sigma24 family protein